GGQPDTGTVKTGGFKNNGVGVIHDAGKFTAHDACHSYGAFFVGDDQHAFVKVAFHIVQGSDFLPIFGGADGDLVAVYILVVKGMHGLAVFQHDIVGNINNIVDGPNAASPQTLPHPTGRGLNFYIFDHPGDITHAELRIFHLYLKQIIDIPVSAFHHRG